MKTGIVVLNYNDYESVFTLVDSIERYSSLDEIAIVDNESTNDSYNILCRKYADSKKISVLSSGKNGGYSYGNNFGLRFLINEKNCDILIVANPDVIFDESLIVAIKEAFRDNEEYGVLSGVMTRPDQTVDPVPYRDFFSYAHDIGDCFLLIRRLKYEKQTFEIDYSKTIMEVPVIQGSFFGITKKAFCDINGLDENVFLYCEELILGKKLVRAGYKTGIITGEKYIHNHAVSIKKSMKGLTVWKNVIKSKYYYQKNYNNVSAFGLLVLRICQGFSVAEKFVIEVLRLL